MSEKKTLKVITDNQLNDLRQQLIQNQDWVAELVTIEGNKELGFQISKTRNY
ncbi:MAG: hypothetical protein mread185_000110 [Mycoplasmataceae bacterium]|nr:MAG: hypothetical protein mread185_000110 [Mycoplasmataceae bacterium]